MFLYEKVCCVTGNRPQNFPWEYPENGNSEVYTEYKKKMGNAIEELIEDGYMHFISGGALGVDLDFAEQVIALRNKYPSITLELVLPCPDHTRKWSNTDKKRYLKVLEKTDKVSCTSEAYSLRCMQIRNEYMVNSSDLVIAFWNGVESGGTFNTMRYARRLNKPVKIVFLSDF